MLRRALTAGQQAVRRCLLFHSRNQLRAPSQEEGQHRLQRHRELVGCGRLQNRSLSTSSSSSSFPSDPSLAGDVGAESRAEGQWVAEGEGEEPGLSPAAVRRRSLRKAIPRPLSELERACIQMLWRRNFSEPIEVTLQRAQFPLTAPNLSLVLSHIRSAKDALRLYLCYLRANPTFVPEKALVDMLTRFWKHERERFPVFLSILNDLRSPSCTMTPRRLTTLLRGYGWAGLVDEVLRYLSSCEASYGFKPDFVHYSCALHTCIDERRLDVALQIFDQMKKDDKPPTYDTFQSLISGLLTINQAKDAAMLFEQMLINQLVKPGELPARVVSYVSIVNELLRSENMRHAGVFLLKINDMGFTPDYFTCSNVLNAYPSRGLVQEQHELCGEMKANGLLPNVNGLKRFVNDQSRGSITLATQKLLNALVTTIESVANSGTSNDAGNPERTPQNDEEAMVEGPGSSIGMQLDCTPPSSDGEVDGADFALFDRVIYGLCAQEKPEDAFELMLRMVEDSNCKITPAASTSMILFDGLCWVTKWEEAERTLRMMMEWGHMPDLKVYNTWVQGSCKHDRLENVSDFLNEFAAKGDLVLDAISHNLLVEKLCMAGKLDEAKRVTKDFSSNLGTPDVVTYSRMIQSFAKAGDFDVPRKLLTEMVEMGITPFALPFTPLVQRLCLAGKIDEALALVDEIETKGCKPLSSLYTLLVSAYCKANRLQDAFNVMDIMKAKGVTPEPQTHKDLFGSCMGTRMLKPAVQAS
eukprot:c20702_g1_i1 orf=62-2323(+)